MKLYLHLVWKVELNLHKIQIFILYTDMIPSINILTIKLLPHSHRLALSAHSIKRLQI